jgi:glycosyltransferase involved in cell wall biosynthesis
MPYLWTRASHYGDVTGLLGVLHDGQKPEKCKVAVVLCVHMGAVDDNRPLLTPDESGLLWPSEADNMRVLDIYGFGDTGLLLTEGLNRLGVDCDMLVSNRQFAGHMPQWSKKYKFIKDSKLYVHRAEDNRDPNTIIDFAKFVNSYDQAIIHRPADMYADLIKIPYHSWDGGSSRFLFQRSTKVKNPPVEADKAAARRAYKHSKTIFANDIDLIYKLFRPRNFKNVVFAPLPVDTDLFRPRRRRRNKKFIIYLPSRQENAVKGTEDMLKGIKTFLQDTRIVDPDSVLVKMPQFGADSAIIPIVLKDLGLDDITEIVPLFPKPEFAKYLNRADVVIDQLRLGAYGGVTIQAMSCARPVIVNAWQEWYREHTSEPPILYAKTAYDVHAQLLNAYEWWEEDFNGMGENARKYAVRHHAYMKVAEQVKERLECQ